MKKYLLTIVCAIACMTGYAKPAYQGSVARTLPDGSTTTVYLHGDEFFHWLTDEQGNWLEETPKGGLVQVPALSDEQIALRHKQSPRRSPQAQQKAYPTNLAPHGLVILVNFQDVEFQPENTQEAMNDMHNGDNYTYQYSFEYYNSTYNIKAEGSVRKYFIDQSMGQYQPKFDVVGPYTVSQDMEYYGANTYGGNDQHPEIMIKEACELAAADGVDFSIYDNDNDGKVDFVYVVYAGYGEADGGSSNTVWPHSYHLSYSYINLILNNKQVDLYACGSELNYVSGSRAGISTFCHEFSHVMGLPDIYVTRQNATWKTSGTWDIMDYGSYNNDGNTPPSYSGYERMFFGWATPRLLNTYGEVTIKELQKYNDVCVITPSGQFNGIANDPDPNIFYVLESRFKQGWDRYIKGRGLMLTRINYNYGKWLYNTVNNTKNDLGIDLIEADGKQPTSGNTGYEGKATDLFPRGCKWYTGIENYAITNIKEQSGTVTFLLEVPNAIEDIVADPSKTTQKVLENGQVVIIRDGVKYSVLGERL